MFGKKKIYPQAVQNRSRTQQTQQAHRQAELHKKGSENSVTILTSDCHFIGKLHCQGPSRIGAKVEGTIFSEGLLIIEEGASVEGIIDAEAAIIKGDVKGTLKAKVRIEFHSSARFEGDIASPVLVVHDGALFNGGVSMLNEVTPGRAQSIRQQ